MAQWLVLPARNRLKHSTRPRRAERPLVKWRRAGGVSVPSSSQARRASETSRSLAALERDLYLFEDVDVDALERALRELETEE